MLTDLTRDVKLQDEAFEKARDGSQATSKLYRP